MTTVQHTVSRFHLLERPVAAPAKCVVCGGYNNPVVDFGFNLRGYGAIVICVDCLGEAGRVIGLIPAGEIAAEKQYAERFIESYLTDNDLVVIPRDFYNTTLDAIRSVSDGLADVVYHIPMAAADAVPDDTTGTAADDSSSSPDEGARTERNRRQSTKPSRSRRSNDVPDDSDDELFGESL